MMLSWDCRLLIKYSGFVAVLALVYLLFVSCGGKTRRVSLPDPPDLPKPPKQVQKEKIKVRLLLLEDFSSCTIEGAEVAGTIRVEADAGGVRLSAVEADNVFLLRDGSGFRIRAETGRLLSLDGRSYRGDFEVFVNPVGQPVVVNEVDVESYLRSVVPKELSPGSFPEVEALKAQAVAARTFAIHELGTWVRYGFDLFSDERSQVYEGTRTEMPLTDLAIAETRGTILTFEEEAILALYSSTCGGLTEDYHLIFKGPRLAYLKGGASCFDQSSPHFQWVQSIDEMNLRRQIGLYADIGRLRDLNPLARGTSGRIVEMRFNGEAGEAILKGNDIRFALGLRSNWITDMEKETDSQGLIQVLHVAGKGWGHGVGMCQFGAVEWAKRGWSHDKILKHYYTDVQLQTSY